jgi:BirA family biotin operon repressor/biotin-[acetyl-CoA-carboxylase] ligase
MYTVHRFSEIGSTNSELKRLAFLGAPTGTVLVADSQTAGRGRMGRSFFSPAGSGVYMSVLVRPVVLADVGLLTTFTAVAVARVLEKYGVDAGIKWVNDLVAGGKKLCGILAEGGAYEGQPFAVLGIGINLKKTAYPAELADIAVSVEELTGVVPDREAMVADILAALAEVDLADPQNAAALMDEYRKRSVTVGRDVRVHPHSGEPYDGIALAKNDDGSLLVQTENGNAHTVFSGEVSVRAR